MARGEEKDPLDVEAAIAGLRRALPLQLRSACAYTLASATLVGFEHVGTARLIAEAGAADLDDARRLAEKLVTLGGQPGDGVPSFELPSDPRALVAQLIDYEAETIEALQDIIPATGHTGASEAIEHRLEHLIMRKQEVVDALERARRRPGDDVGSGAANEWRGGPAGSGAGGGARGSARARARARAGRRGRARR